MKKLFKKSIACLIAVLMVVSSMPFTALTANAALVKQDIAVWDAANVAAATPGTRDKFTHTDSSTNVSINGVHWGSASKVAGNDYVTFNNATISSEAGFSSLNIKGDVWTFSSKFATTGEGLDDQNTHQTTEGDSTIFGIGTATPRDYSPSDAAKRSGMAADLVNITMNGNIYLAGSSTSSGTVANIISTSADDVKTLTVAYDNGNLTISLDGTPAYTGTVDEALFSQGVSNFFIGTSAQVYAGGTAPYYGLTNGGHYTYGTHLYLLSGSVSYDPTNVPPSANAQTAYNNINNANRTYNNVRFTGADTNYLNGVITGTSFGGSTTATVDRFSDSTDTKHESKVHGLTDGVAIYTGSGCDIRFPVVYEHLKGDNKWGVTHYVGIDHLYFSSGNFQLGQDTWKRCEGWNNLTDNSDNSHDFSALSTGKVDRAENTATGRFTGTDKKFWKNCIKYTGSVNTDTYYEMLTNANFNYQADYTWSWLGGRKWASKSNYTSTFSSTFGLYVINYAPLKEIIESEDFKSNFETIYNNRWMYDEAAREKYFEVMAKITTFNLSEKTMTNESQVSNVAAEIKGMVDDYKLYKSPAKKKITVTFRNSTDTDTISTKIFDAGNAIGAFPANTETSPDEHGYGDIYHNKYTWDTALTPESVPTSNITIYEKATPEAHSSTTPATCITKQICDACGAEFGSFGSHNLTETVAKNATCTEAGNSAYWTCSDCGKMFSDANAATEITEIPTTPATGHHLTETAAKNATCTEAGNSAYWTCSDCGKMFSDANAATEITKIPTIPATGLHDYEVEYNAETNVDVFTCKNCGDTYSKAVADMSALKEAIVQLEAAINVDDAAYKYDATALENAKSILNAAKDYVANDNNRYASIQDVNAMSTSVGTAYTKLTVDGLAKYSQTFIIRKDDGKGNTTDIATFTQGYENLAYGSTVEFSDYTIPTINDGSTLTGLPMYAVYKWVKTVNGVEQKLGTTDVQISDVVKGETTYICYVLDFKATDETQKTTRVRYLDKSGNTIKFDTATVGEPYTRKDTSIAPIIPYYNCTGWEPLFGDETNVGTRELVYRAIYTFNETEANRCTIVGLPGVYVNGTTGTPGYTAYYDEKIQLTGADKYAYANADGSIIAPINESYIFAPHLNGVDKTIYITKVETPITEAKSIITGVFTTHEDTTYNYLVINAQYYLPEGAKAVEAGAVIGKYNNADTLKIGSAVKVVSDTQGDNHEYSLQMSYSKNKTGTLYARSYLIYVDSNGDTQTVYSDDITTCNLD
ncbi:MAG: hypothetical protein PUE46_01670 [Eubacteriales bacterium]|nr:hypothetical protein [Eubacteriales bacterium]